MLLAQGADLGAGDAEGDDAPDGRRPPGTPSSRPDAARRRRGRARQGQRGPDGTDQAAVYGESTAVEALLEAGARANSRLWLWQGYRSARQGRFAESLPLLEKAALDTSTPQAPWRFTIDGWVYEVPEPGVFTWLLVGVSRRQTGLTAAAADAYRKAAAAIPSGAAAVLLVRRTHNAPHQLIMHDYRVFRTVLESQAIRPERLCQLALSFRDEQRGMVVTRAAPGSRTPN